MKKKITLSLLAIVLTTTIFNTKVFTYNIGAYGGYSGAPSDATCAIGGCHSSYAINSAGPGSVTTTLTDSLGNAATIYKPGSRYNVAVTVSYTGRSTFGFETTVRKTSTNTQIGKLMLSTGVQFCPYPFNSTNYVTHEYSSISGSGSKTWTFTWTAPGSDVGNIEFYTAGNAANGDGNVDGDYIYTNHLLFASPTGISPNAVAHFVSVYPNPATDIIHALYSLREPSQVGISVLDLHGRVVKNISYHYSSAGEQQMEANIGDMAKGVYFLKIEAAGTDSYFKIIKE